MTLLKPPPYIGTPKRIVLDWTLKLAGCGHWVRISGQPNRRKIKACDECIGGRGQWADVAAILTKGM